MSHMRLNQVLQMNHATKFTLNDLIWPTFHKNPRHCALRIAQHFDCCTYFTCSGCTCWMTICELPLPSTTISSRKRKSEAGVELNCAAAAMPLGNTAPRCGNQTASQPATLPFAIAEISMQKVRLDSTLSSSASLLLLTLAVVVAIHFRIVKVKKSQTCGPSVSIESMQLIHSAIWTLFIKDDEKPNRNLNGISHFLSKAAAAATEIPKQNQTKQKIPQRKTLSSSKSN